ncbi:NAD(P)/FAD-dependent oxidoreductase [Synechococcus sp. MU1643]|uniref:NAD(P)/FAD-dependent oxidoreductase n=1 Tax=Synechococcus sp. MU1643 TaxID=2508349 RepID=UPI001CF8281C|nr:NAD(P)/FAD-dependent oxidoreductase [Synechococcus sp. MU1643]
MSVLIVGAGPSGARLAIQLARAGVEVTLVDRLADPNRNAYSSGALPLDAVRRLGLPDEAIAATWQGWQLHDPSGLVHQWWSASDLGVVLDFGRLRSWLWEQARCHGVELISDCRASLSSLTAEGASVRLQMRDGQTTLRSARWLIDATGARRDLLQQAGLRPNPEDPLLQGIGVEWLLQADDRQAAAWRDRISFFLGTAWIPHGYAWIFPMQGQRLKVGVCHLPPADRSTPGSLAGPLKRLIHRCGLSSCPVLDRHGGPLSSSISRTEPLVAGALLAVGDAASSANLLGGEGIRHAMDGADQLADLLIAEGIWGDSSTMARRYQHQLKAQRSWRWLVSGRLARRTWWGLDNPRADRRLRRLIHGLSVSTEAPALSELLFEYNFERYGLRLLPYLL